MKLKTLLVAAGASLLAGGLVLAQPYGIGPGPGGGGYRMGMGPGMMGGMGWGTTGGYAFDSRAGLDLTAEQRKQIAEIQESNSKAMWQLMGTMREQGLRMHGPLAPGMDDAQARKAYEAMAATRQAMFELRLETRRKIDAVLTDPQREQLRRYWGG